MLKPIFLLAFLASSYATAQVAVSAQGPGFGCFANIAGSTAFDAETPGTNATWLVVEAALRRIQGNDQVRSSTLVEQVADHGVGAGVQLLERGVVRNSIAAQAVSAGTSGTTAAAATAPSAHRLRLNYPGFLAGTSIVVIVAWQGDATSGADVRATVDVNADGVPEFTAGPTGNLEYAALRVTAGPGGLVIDVTTNGRAGLSGVGHEHYEGMLTVRAAPGSVGTDLRMLTTGASCRGTLNGSVDSNRLLLVEVTDSVPLGFGAIFVGGLLNTPVPLPAGGCELLISSVPIFTIYIWTDANGHVETRWRTPPVPVALACQAVLVALDSAGAVETISATNALVLVSQ